MNFLKAWALRCAKLRCFVVFHCGGCLGCLGGLASDCSRKSDYCCSPSCPMASRWAANCAEINIVLQYMGWRSYLQIVPVNMGLPRMT